MITLIDTFNGVEISKHRTLIAAVKAQRRHLARVRKANGQNSYLTYAFRDGVDHMVPADEIAEVRQCLDCVRAASHLICCR